MTDPGGNATATHRGRFRLLPLLLLLLAILLLLVSRLFFGATVVRDELQLLTPTSHVGLGQEIRAPETSLLLGFPNRPAKNVIIVMVDGLGFNHVAAARLALGDHAAPLSFERLPVTGWHYPFPSRGLATDSAASATAIATGVATTNGSVSTDPNGRTVETLLEHAARMGKATGIVTDSYIWDATPGAFGSHAQDRENVLQLLQGFADSSLDLLLGELEDVDPGSASWQEQVTILQQRFLVAESGVELEAIANELDPIASALPEHQVEDSTSTPNLRRLTEIALQRLSRSQNGFVLVVESEEPDSASHRRDFDRLIAGMESLEETMQEILRVAATDGETLVVVTGDHETGGLTLHPSRGNDAVRIRWGSDDHTVSPIPIYAGGPGAAGFSGVQHNTELFDALLQAMSPRPEAPARTPEAPSH